MKQKIYQVDAFADRLFAGNPAAVCPLTEWLPDAVMQNIAMENNLAETVFYVPDGDQFIIRWFTPLVEVDLCGHATFAAAYILFNYAGYDKSQINFFSPRSGALTVTKQQDWLTLNFPVDVYEPIAITEAMGTGLGASPTHAFKGKTDYLLVYKDETTIKNLTPDFNSIAKWDVRGIIVTAKGDTVDFVSRFFAPQCGINEDPVTGSTHTTLIPYWAKEYGKEELTALQLSYRKGFLRCKYLTNRVEISGQGQLYLTGEIHLPE
jgi:PhzF family phenazine biosynthesis protein